MTVPSLHVTQLDEIMAASLTAFAADTLGSRWCGKEHDWVNRYAHSYLLKHCAPAGPLHEPGQIAIEVGVPQPPGYSKPATRRDLVIWARSGLTCWDADWRPVHHPLAIVEWKVHRPGRRNPDQPQEREWLRRYTQWQTAPVAYAVEIHLGCTPHTLTCSRFHAGSEVVEWLHLAADTTTDPSSCAPEHEA
jgi:hypothetical protein